MIKFLLQRPISVIMTFLACVIIGIITYTTLPVSLLPDIPIPQITVQITGDNMSARELESTVVTNIRRHLMQTGNLRDMRSETRDGSAIIRLVFNHGTNTNLAFIEVNENVDAAMNGLPRDFPRPRVIKANANDLPVFFLNLTLRDDVPFGATDEQRFLDLSDFAENMVRRRIEQLPEVAMADITGRMFRHLQITPNMNLMESVGFTLEDIQNVLNANNIDFGSMEVRDGHLVYNIRFSSLLRTPDDVRNIFLRRNDRIFQLRDLADIEVVRQSESGMSLINGKRAVTMSIIQRSEETMANLKQSLDATLADLERNHPEIEFTISRNQTELLNHSISNLQRNLLIGFLLVFIVSILFLGDAKAPVIIGLTMTSSLITTFVFLYLFGQSLNIISLAGLILALGMMIDSSIIVTDIISQYRMKGYSLEESCIKGTNEVITPILSSTLTTIAVFVPLVFMSGMAGAIFFAQAFAVSAGLLVAYATGIILLPVLYKLIYGIQIKENVLSRFFKRTQTAADGWLFRWYDNGFAFVFRHKTLSFIFLALAIPFSVWMFQVIPTSAMPHIDYSETIVRIDWNENIHVDENKRRVLQLTQSTDGIAVEHAAYVGMQQYLLNREDDLTPSEAILYFRTEHPGKIAYLHTHIVDFARSRFPQAVITFSPPENIFEKIFDTAEADVIVQLYASNRDQVPSVDAIRAINQSINYATGLTAEDIAFEQQIVITVDRERLLLYGIGYQQVHRLLRTAFRENEIAMLRSYQQFLPISLAGREQSVEHILRTTLVPANRPDGQTVHIPLSALVSISHGEDIKTIVAGRHGEFIPLHFNDVPNPEAMMTRVEEVVRANRAWEVMFAGGFFSNRQMINELMVILLISLLLMYFILSSQFESFLQPLIVLLEIPTTIGFSLLFLWLTGHTLNLMSAIGIIVTCAIIINDSILKLDMMNRLRKDGLPLMEAIHTAGVQRLRAIIMTSLTTVCAMAPLLFTSDLGSELQRPLAIAMVSTMVVGVLVSLFMLPVVYWAIYRKHDRVGNADDADNADSRR